MESLWLKKNPGQIRRLIIMDCPECKTEMISIGLVVVDRTTLNPLPKQHDKLIFSGLEQCPKCKTINLNEGVFA